MTNRITTSCGCLVTLLQPLQCDFPACNCEKCQLLRSEDKCEQDECSQELENEDIEETESFIECLRKHICEDECDNNDYDDAPCPIATGAVSQDVTLTALFSRFSYNFQPENIYSVLFDVVGTIAFIVMATITFWFIVAVYIWRFILAIYYAGRKPQIITLSLFSLLLMCIIFHAMSGHRMNRLQKENPISFHDKSPSDHEPTSPEGPKKAVDSCASSENLKRPSKHKCSHKSSLSTSPSLTSSSSSECNLNDDHLKTSQTRVSGGSDTHKHCGMLRQQASESLCNLCAKKFKKSGSNTFISDKEARQIYNKYQLCAIPMEWKSPPSPIVYIVEYVKHLFSASSTSIGDI